MFDRLGELASEHAELERALADPSVHADADQARTLAKRYAELTPIVTAYREWPQAGEDEQAARELATEDPAFATEAEDLAKQREELEDRLRVLLVPKDPNDDRDTLLEVKAGRGSVGAWSRLKYEGGVHRVQRVPVTESQGRIHTSAAGVLVMPEADPVDVQINDNDIKVDVFRSSGPGGQSVNTTDSAVRITHLPTGIVVSCQNEKSQLQNKEQALRVLRARLLAQAEADADAKAMAERKAQVRTVDRSERVRTYNFPENRISDHRVGYKAYNLDQVIDGDLDAVIDALAAADLEAKLAEG